MKLYCKECGSLIPADDMNIATMTAKCGKCNSVFSFSDKIGGESSFEDKSARRAPVPLPKGIHATEMNGKLQIGWKWFRWSNVFLTFFTIFWDCFMIVWFTISISTEMYAMAAFGSLHAGVGLYLTYTVLANYINSTSITVDRENVSVKIGPLPWPGNHNIKSSDITQLYSKSVITRNRNSISENFEVHAVLKNRTHLCLVKTLEEMEQAFYIEQKIEDFLKIEDEPVRGEIQR